MYRIVQSPYALCHNGAALSGRITGVLFHFVNLVRVPLIVGRDRQAPLVAIHHLEFSTGDGFQRHRFGGVLAQVGRVEILS